MSSNFLTLNSLYKDLISESTITSLNTNIKFLSFLPEEIAKYKQQDLFYVIRSISELTSYNIGDYIKTEWGRVYKIEDSQIYANIEDCPQISLLSFLQIEEIADNNITVKALKLVRVFKKNVKRFFYDLEFDETKNTRIELISLGMVDELGNLLYLINKDYDWSTANEWLRVNVYPYIKDAPDYLKVDLNTIKMKVLKFINPGPSKDIKLYGYYSAYDHVCLCQLFGTMNKLPEHMPMYTNDLQQTLDYFNENIKSLNITESIQLHNALSDAKFNLDIYRAIEKKYNPKYL